MFRFTRICALLVLWAWGPAFVRAEGPVPVEPASTAHYESALGHALEAYEARDFSRALAYFERAHALDPSARTLRGIGVVQLELGRPVAAVVALEESLVHPIRPLGEQLEIDVQRLLIRARKELAILSLQTTPLAARVRVDGGAPVLSTTGQLLLSPGAHTLHIEAPGYAAYETELRLELGQRESLRIALAPIQRVAQEAPEKQTRTETTATPPERDATRRLRIAPLSFGMLGAASLIAAGGLWATVLFRFNEIKDECREAGGCAAGEPRRKVVAARLPALQRSSRALSAIGVLSVGTSFAFWLKSRRELDARLALGTSSVELSLRF